MRRDIQALPIGVSSFEPDYQKSCFAIIEEYHKQYECFLYANNDKSNYLCPENN